MLAQSNAIRKWVFAQSAYPEKKTRNPDVRLLAYDIGGSMRAPEL
jgi:hypothetical protein